MEGPLNERATLWFNFCIQRVQKIIEQKFGYLKNKCYLYIRVSWKSDPKEGRWPDFLKTDFEVEGALRKISASYYDIKIMKNIEIAKQFRKNFCQPSHKVKAEKKLQEK